MVILLEISYLTEAVMLSQNIDDRKFKMALKLAQEILRTVLGSEFYDEIETQFSTTIVSFTTDNSTLYENYIKDYLAWQTYVEFISFAQLDSTPTGFREHNDENSTLAQDVRYFSLSKNVRLNADLYRNKMVNFLKLAIEKDSTKYPLWIGCQQNTFAFGISSVSGRNQGIINVHKAIIAQE